jgi:hypothetical protein
VESLLLWHHDKHLRACYGTRGPIFRIKFSISSPKLIESKTKQIHNNGVVQIYCTNPILSETLSEDRIPTYVLLPVRSKIRTGPKIHRTNQHLYPYITRVERNGLFQRPLNTPPNETESIVCGFRASS